MESNGKEEWFVTPRGQLSAGVEGMGTVVARVSKSEVGRADAIEVHSDAKELEDRYAAYLHDESKLRGGLPRSLSFPRSIEDLSQILAAHYERNEPSTISGARTGIAGAAAPVLGAHLISLDKLKGIGAVQHDDAGRPFIRAAAGETLQSLNESLASTNPTLFFPVDPTETWASIGGIVSTNASGARTFHYGPVRPWVRAVDVVLADGSVARLQRGESRIVGGKFLLQTVASDGSRLEREFSLAEAIPKPPTKNTIGYSYEPEMELVDLFIGAEGTLGAVAAAELFLAPLPESRLYFLQFFADDEQALSFVEKVRQDKAIVAFAIEYFDRRSLELVSNSPLRATNPIARMVDSSCGAAVYTELEFSDEEQFAALYERLEEIVGSLGASMEHSFAGTEDRDLRELKTFRHAVPEHINATIAKRKLEHPTLHKVATDMAVPDAHLKAIYRLYRERLDQAGLEYAIFGHGGNNHFHVNIMPRNGEELAKGKSFYREFAEEAVRMGGSVAAEHGIGRLKREFLTIQYDSNILDRMRQIRRFFDPKLLLNQGVLFE